MDSNLVRCTACGEEKPSSECVEVDVAALLARTEAAEAERDRLRDVLVDRWHETCPNEERSLHEWMGMTWDEYADWVSPRAALAGSSPAAEAEPDPEWVCSVCSVERADCEGPNRHLEFCPNCGLSEAPERSHACMRCGSVEYAEVSYSGCTDCAPEAFGGAGGVSDSSEATAP